MTTQYLHTQNATTRRRCGRNDNQASPRELSAYRANGIASDQAHIPSQTSHDDVSFAPGDFRVRHIIHGYLTCLLFDAGMVIDRGHKGRGCIFTNR